MRSLFSAAALRCSTKQNARSRVRFSGFWTPGSDKLCVGEEVEKSKCFLVEIETAGTCVGLPPPREPVGLFSLILHLRGNLWS